MPSFFNSEITYRIFLVRLIGQNGLIIILMKRYVIYVFIKPLSFLRLLSKNKLKKKVNSMKNHIFIIPCAFVFTEKTLQYSLYSLNYWRKIHNWTTLPFSSVFLINHVYFELHRFFFIENSSFCSTCRTSIVHRTFQYIRNVGVGSCEC